MKMAVVPAQITTVEDTLMGGFTITQVLLIAIAVVVDMAIYIAIPTMFQISIYKVITMSFVSLVCVLLALRIQDKLLLIWIRIIGGYLFRHKKFVFIKQDLYLRSLLSAEKSRLAPVSKKSPVKTQVKTDNSIDTKTFVAPLYAIPKLSPVFQLHDNGKVDLRYE